MRCNNMSFTYRFSEQKVVIFGLDAQVFEDRIGPKAFHSIPVFNLSMSDRIIYTVPRPTGRGQSLIANKEIKVLGPALCRQVGT